MFRLRLYTCSRGNTWFETLSCHQNPCSNLSHGWQTSRNPWIRQFILVDACVRWACILMVNDRQTRTSGADHSETFGHRCDLIRCTPYGGERRTIAASARLFAMVTRDSYLWLTGGVGRPSWKILHEWMRLTCVRRLLNHLPWTALVAEPKPLQFGKLQENQRLIFTFANDLGNKRENPWKNSQKREEDHLAVCCYQFRIERCWNTQHKVHPCQVSRRVMNSLGLNFYSG